MIINREAESVAMALDEHKPDEPEGLDTGENHEQSAWLGIANILWRKIAEEALLEYSGLEVLGGATSSWAEDQEALQQGWREGSAEAILHGNRFSLATLLDPQPLHASSWLNSIEQYDAERADEIASWLPALHTNLFPNAFYSGIELLQRLDDQRIIFAITDAVRGYIYVEADSELGEGRIEYVGVADPDRDQGVGQALVTAAVRWLFSFAPIHEVTLICSHENQRAIAFYERLGFQLLHIVHTYFSPPQGNTSC